MPSRKRFAGYPSAVAFAQPDGKRPLQHLLWGDFILDKGQKQGTYKVKDVHGDTVTGKYVRCHIRGFQDDIFVREHEVQDDRVLEVIFVDIGQGDGCLVVTPDDKQMIIDAGVSDHYMGFDRFFDDPKVFFDTIYTNGIMEEFPASKKKNDSLGPRKKIGRSTFLARSVTSKSELQSFLNTKARWEKKVRGRVFNKQFPTMLKKGLDAKKFKKQMDETIDRSVAVFGAINVITDGHKVVIAQKLEVSRGNDEKWDICRLEPEGNGPIRFQAKH
ncbi:MAG: hypothetical protein GY711_20520 [bacterium]|nr:hypothetical protein [bacterium]